MNQLFVGIDVSSKNNVAYLMKPDGSKHSSFSVQNNLSGAKLLSERIVSALGAMQLSDVAIGLEATSIYGDSLVYALREDGSLGRFGRKIHVLNPKQVKKFKDAYSDLPKNDYVDAFVIADHLRFGRTNREVYMDDYRYKALQNLTRARFDVVQSLTREKQRFANYLFLKCSGLAQDKDIANSSATTIALMEKFETVDKLAYADLDELTAFIDETGRNFANPATKAKAIQIAARNSYRLPITVNHSVNQAMSVSIATMRALEKQIKVLDKALSNSLKSYPIRSPPSPASARCTPLVSSPRLATSTGLTPKPLLPSTPALSGHSTNPVILKHSTPNSLSPATDISATTCWKPPTP